MKAQRAEMEPIAQEGRGRQLNEPLTGEEAPT